LLGFVGEADEVLRDGGAGLTWMKFEGRGLWGLREGLQAGSSGGGEGEKAAAIHESHAQSVQLKPLNKQDGVSNTLRCSSALTEDGATARLAS